MTHKPVTKRRKTTRKPPLRKDRVALVLTIFAAFIVLIVSAVSRACGDTGAVRPGGQLPAAVPSAAEAARRDAAAAAAAPVGSMQRQNALLEIHARHSQLQEAGHIQAADQYISTARNLLLSQGVITR